MIKLSRGSRIELNYISEWRKSSARRHADISFSAFGLSEAQHDPVGVPGWAALVCLAAALVAASVVQTGRTELSHSQGFSVVSLFYFCSQYLFGRRKSSHTLTKSVVL